MTDPGEFWIAGKPFLKLKDFPRSPWDFLEGFPDVYDWICHLVKGRSDRYGYLRLNVYPEKAGSLYLGSQFTDSDKLSLFLLSDFRKLFDLGMCSTGFAGKESGQKNTFQVFSNMYARVYFNDFSADIVKLDQVDIQLGTIESAKYKQAFNSLFSVACYSFLVHARYEISESEVQKFPCHRAEDVLSIIGSGYPDIYDWICQLELGSEMYEYLPLNIHPEKPGSLFLGSQFTASDKASLFLSSGFRKLFDLGMCSTGIVGEESRQKNTFLVFWNLFARVYFKSFNPDLVKLEQMDIQLGTIESAKYKQAFNSLFSVACYSFLVHARYEISESEVQKLPCHRAEDVLSIIGLPTQTFGYPDVYDWIYHLDPTRSEKSQFLPLNVHYGKAFSLFLEFEFTDSDKVSFFLSSGFRKLLHLGMCSTGFAGEESGPKNTFQVFSNMYARVSFNDFSADIVKLDQVDIQLGTIESAKYKQAFNSLFSVACYSFLVHARYEISESEVQKFPCHRAEDVLSIIGLPTQTFGYPDIYDWIYHLDPTRSEKSQFLPLNVHYGKAFSLFLEFEFTDSDKVSFFLSSGFCKLLHLGMCSTGFAGEESGQKNTFQVFSNMYARVYFNDFSADIVKLDQVDIQLGTIESAKYKQAFNSLFSVACYSFLVHARYEISESEVQKFPCHRAEDVLSIIGSGYPDIYDWICQLELGSEMYEYLPLNIHPEKAGSLFLGSQFTASDKASLFLSSGFRKLFDLGMCSTGIVGEESRQKNTFLVFWNLFARVYFKSFNPDLVKLEQMDIQLGTIESAKYKQAFNSLFSVACYSFLLHSSFKISESQMQEFPCHRAEDILSIIGTGAANLLLRCLSTEFTYKSIQGKSDIKGANELGISYCSSNLPGFWIINSYCPMLSMSRTSKGQIADQITSDKRLSNALSYQQLQCVLQFRHAVNVYRDFIEVRLEIDNVGCDVIRLNPPHKPIPTSLKDERHFPARICITIGPQVESHVHHVSLTKSSQNPVTNIARGKAVEATFEPPNYVPGLKISNGTSSQISIKSWVFEQSFVNRPHVNLEWILYDSTTGKEVFNYRPKKIAVFNSKTWSGDRYSKASRAFTTQGGVVFTGDEYGQPITWRVNRDLQGQTVNWVVKGDICLAYFSNTYSSAHFDIANHQFSQVVQFPLVQSTPN